MSPHCKDIVSAPRMADSEAKETEQFSVTLPRQALDMIEELKAIGLYGRTRGEITRALVLARLEDLLSRGIVKRRD